MEAPSDVPKAEGGAEQAGGGQDAPDQAAAPAGQASCCQASAARVAELESILLLISAETETLRRVCKEQAERLEILAEHKCFLTAGTTLDHVVSAESGETSRVTTQNDDLADGLSPDDAPTGSPVMAAAGEAAGADAAGYPQQPQQPQQLQQPQQAQRVASGAAHGYDGGGGAYLPSGARRLSASPYEQDLSVCSLCTKRTLARLGEIEDLLKRAGVKEEEKEEEEEVVQEEAVEEEEHEEHEEQESEEEDEDDQRERLAFPDVDDPAGVAEALANKGFTVRQLLEFYIENEKNGKLGTQTLTKDVVRDIVLPETASKQSCYMESAFMQERGGPRRAKKAVSHSWDARFLHTVLNIVLDATGWAAEVLLSIAGLKFDQDAEVKMQRVLDELDRLGGGVCDSTYWLCIFAINEHASICGDCLNCRQGADWIKERLVQEPCSLCNEPKPYPCKCGLHKRKAGEPQYETDKFGGLIKLMDALVVSLDAELVALTRLWVVYEVGEAALHHIRVRIRMALGLHSKKAKLLQEGKPAFPLASKCHTMYGDFKERVVKQISTMKGGSKAFNEFMKVFMELSLGRCVRLAAVEGTAAVAIEELPQLEMNFRWCADFLTDLSEKALGGGHLGKLKKLRMLRMDFTDCAKLSNVSALQSELEALGPHLRELDLNFNMCSSLADVSALGSGLASMEKLEKLSLTFSRCTSLQDVAPIGQALGKLTGIKQVRLLFDGCKALKDVTPLHTLNQLTGMKQLFLDLDGCTSLAEVATMGQGLSELGLKTSLEHFDLLTFDIPDRAKATLLQSKAKFWRHRQTVQVKQQ